MAGGLGYVPLKGDVLEAGQGRGGQDQELIRPQQEAAALWRSSSQAARIAMVSHQGWAARGSSSHWPAQLHMKRSPEPRPFIPPADMAGLEHSGSRSPGKAPRWPYQQSDGHCSTL